MSKSIRLKTILVDDEALARQHLKGLLVNNASVDIEAEVANGYEALEFVRKNAIDLAFLDIEMPKMNGLELAEELHTIDPNIVIIFTTGFEKYAMDAYRKHALGYLVKPCDECELFYYLDQVSQLRKKSRKHALSIRAFGRFDVSCEDRLMVFSNAKSKELLALLVDACGGEVSMELACDILWEMHPYGESVKALYRRAVTNLRKLIKEHTDEEVLIVSRGSLALNKALVNCDYYDHLKTGVPEFSGEYMTQYAWAENTIASLAFKNDIL